jgi:rifampin ADP-ribosylating transferase
MATPAPLVATLPGGLRLPYVEQGDGSAGALVLLHGYVESWRSFERMLPLLPPALRAVAFTQRGHGDADKPPAGYELGQASADVASFLDAVGLERAVLVGSSSGGYVAQRFALDFPARVRGLVLLGAPRSLRTPPAIARRIEQLEDPVAPELVREFVAATSSGSVPPAFLATMAQEAAKAPARVWKAVLAGLVGATPPTETGVIGAPTLLIWGAEDTLVPLADQRRLAAETPRAQLLVYEQAGHVVHWDQPERVAADLTAFVRALAVG